MQGPLSRSVLLASTLLLAGCLQAPKVPVELTETAREATVARQQVTVDNCAGQLPKIQLYDYPFVSGGLGTRNLMPNGGEPFISIRIQLTRHYGTQAPTLFMLIVPPRTQRDYTLRGDILFFQGHISGPPSLQANKIDPNNPVTYHYPFLSQVQVESQQDQPCS